MAKKSYATDYEPPRFLVPIDRLIDKISSRFAISKEEAAQAILADEEYGKWSESYQDQ